VDDIEPEHLKASGVDVDVDDSLCDEKAGIVVGVGVGVGLG